MKEIFGSIDRQIHLNKGKNFFRSEPFESLQFLSGTIRQAEKTGDLSQSDKELLIDYTTEKVFQEFCRINQYYSFSGCDKNELRAIYSRLFEDVSQKHEPIETISERHYLRLKKWLEKSNPFAEVLYSGSSNLLDPVACAEYSPALQLGILQIDLSKLKNPVLDIGCGKDARLVKFLRSEGFDAYGVDRFQTQSEFVFEADWLEFVYGIRKWGTIISNLGFSNHFHHHHLRSDGNYLGYAKKFMEILRSLKQGGSFYYAPDLPFIEPLLDPTKYIVENRKAGDYPFRSAVITRS
jgi:SAM-dependent methyltransferase